jgi:hypothetical protein
MWIPTIHYQGNFGRSERQIYFDLIKLKGCGFFNRIFAQTITFNADPSPINPNKPFDRAHRIKIENIKQSKPYLIFWFIILLVLN